MDYLQIYDDLINKALNQNRKKRKRDHKDFVYYERHHIVPRCLGGGDEKENLVLLTAKEHFVAHKLLAEIFPEEKGLVEAIWLMSISKNNDHKISSRDYEIYKILRSKHLSKKNSGVGNPMYGKIPWNKDKIGIYTKTTLEKMSNSRIGKYQTKESIEKMLKTKRDRDNFKHTDESIANLKKSWGKNRKEYECPYCGFKSKVKPILTQFHFEKCKKHPNYIPPIKERKIYKYKRVICPHCGKIGGDNIMYRYHFDNCKFKK